MKRNYFNLRLSEITWLLQLIFVIVAILFLFLVVPSAGVDKDGATQVLVNAGYTDINITGYGFLECSEDDFYHTRFTAVSPIDQPVSGTVCSGFFKGKTIRFD